MFKKETEVREIVAEKAVLKHENQTMKLTVKAAETELKGAKKVLAICQVSNRNIKDENEKLVEMVNELKAENQYLKSGTNVLEDELNTAKRQLEKMHNTETKYKGAYKKQRANQTK